mgnify:CR=1 FL=1
MSWILRFAQNDNKIYLNTLLFLDTPKTILYPILVNPEEKRVYQVAIPFKLDIASVIKRLRLNKTSRRLEEIAHELVEKARAMARPRAVYQLSHAYVIDRATVDIDGIRFTSRVLSKLLRNQDTVVPFIATIGKELDELPTPPTDMMRKLCLDTIKTLVLVSSVDYLTEYLKEKFAIPRAALLNPGEIEDWPIAQQKQLFALFGGTERKIGVTLTAGGAMKPIKSRSGIVFPNDTGFVSCQLCTQLKCPGRRAKYDPELAKEYLG